MFPILITTVQGDFGFAWNFTLTDAKQAPLDISGATSLMFEAQLASDSAVQSAGAMAKVVAASGTCKYVVQANDFTVPGTYTAQIKVIFPSETVTFSGITVTVTPKVPVS